MANERISGALAKFRDKLEEAAIFQQIKAKWEELDPQRRTHYQIGALAFLGLGAVYYLGTAYFEVSSLKRQILDKREALNLIRGASDDLRALHLDAGGGAGEGSGWAGYLQSVATEAGLDAESLKVGEERAPGEAATDPKGKTADASGDKPSASDLATETLIDVALSGVRLEQIIKYALALEAGARPAKLRSLSIEKVPDSPDGLAASLSISAYQVK